MACAYSLEVSIGHHHTVPDIAGTRHICSDTLKSSFSSSSRFTLWKMPTVADSSHSGNGY